jgi:spore coat protein U-like protein
VIMSRRKGLAAALLLLCWCSGAGAAGVCTISTVGVAFGAYDPNNPTPTTSLGSVVTTCEWTSGGSSEFNVTTSFSPGNSGSYPNRWMLRPGSTDRLNYNLYLDAGYTLIAGNGTAGTSTGGPTQIRVSRGQPMGAATTLYGRIPAAQSPSPGNYSDTITVTLMF